MKIVRTIGLVLLAILLAGCAGQQLHREALALMAEGQAEAGLAKLTEATQAAPGNTRYRADLLRSREQTVNRMLAAAASEQASSVAETTSTIEEIKIHTGWDLKISPNVKTVPEPTELELKILREVDETGFLRKKK